MTLFPIMFLHILVMEHVEHNLYNLNFSNIYSSIDRLKVPIVLTSEKIFTLVPGVRDSFWDCEIYIDINPVLICVKPIENIMNTIPSLICPFIVCDVENQCHYTH